MEEIELKSGNKLIAEFLGFMYNSDWVMRPNVKNPSLWIEQYSLVVDPHYDTWRPQSDWNQLMLVVDKIESIDENLGVPSPNNFHIFIGKRHVRIIYDWENWQLSPDDVAEDKEKFKLFEAASKDYRYCLYDESKIKATWHLVVDFIKWWNEKQKKDNNGTN